MTSPTAEHTEVGPREIEELEAECDQLLICLIELLTKESETVAPSKTSPA